MSLVVRIKHTYGLAHATQEFYYVLYPNPIVRFDRCIWMCTCCFNQETEHIFTWVSPGCFYVYFFPLFILPNTDILVNSFTFASLWQWHIKWTIVYVAFQVWVLIKSYYLRVVRGNTLTIVYYANRYSVVSFYHNLFIHSPINGHSASGYEKWICYCCIPVFSGNWSILSCWKINNSKWLPEVSKIDKIH